jgi:hypothetical protein
VDIARSKIGHGLRRRRWNRLERNLFRLHGATTAPRRSILGASRSALAGKLNGDFVLTRATGSAHGNVECGFDKKIIARNVEADLPVDRDLSAALPPAFQALRGKLHAQIAYLRLDGQVIKAIEGVIVARDLTDGEGATSQPWGSYSLTFPPPTNGEPLGRLADLGTGPLAVEGSLRLTPEPGFDLEGLVAARPSAPAGLAQEIQFLGSPDAQGRRPFSLAGTF